MSPAERAPTYVSAIAELAGATLHAQLVLIFLSPHFPLGTPDEGLSLVGSWQNGGTPRNTHYLVPAESPIMWATLHREPVVLEGPLLALVARDIGIDCRQISRITIVPLGAPESEGKGQHYRPPTAIGALCYGVNDEQIEVPSPNRSLSARATQPAELERLVSDLCSRILLACARFPVGQEAHESALEHFLDHSVELAEALGGESIEILSLAFVDTRLWSHYHSVFEQAEAFDRMIRLLHSALPPHFPMYMSPGGELYIACDQMMSDLILRRIHETLAGFLTHTGSERSIDVTRLEIRHYLNDPRRCSGRVQPSAEKFPESATPHHHDEITRPTPKGSDLAPTEFTATGGSHRQRLRRALKQALGDLSKVPPYQLHDGGRKFGYKSK